MVSTYTSNKRIEMPANGDYASVWNVPVNADWSIIDTALGGASTLNATALAGVVALTITDYRPLRMNVTGTPSGTVTYQVPSGVGGFWVVVNGTTGGQVIQFSSAAGGAVVPIPTGTQTLITCDGTASGMGLVITTSPAAGGSNTQVQYNSAGLLTGSNNLTFDGTTLTVNGLQTTGATALGNATGDTLAIACGTWTLGTSININSNALFFNPATAQLGVGTPTVGSNSITAVGQIKSLAGGFVFPDGSVQLTASTGGGGGSPGGSTGAVQVNGGGTTFSGFSNFSFSGSTLFAPSLQLTTPLALSSGGTGATSGAAARAALGAAGSGANSDITSLNALSSLVVSGAASFGSLSVSGSFSPSSVNTGAVSATSVTSSGALTAGVGSRTGDSITYLITSGGLPVVQMGSVSIYVQSGQMNFNGNQMSVSSSAFSISSTNSFNPSGVWIASSDRRLKEGIVGVDAKSAVERVLALTPVDFNWKSAPVGRPVSDRGFIAQDVAQVYPADVVEGDDGYLGIGLGRPFYADVVAMLQQIWRRLERLDKAGRITGEQYQ